MKVLIKKKELMLVASKLVKLIKLNKFSPAAIGAEYSVNVTIIAIDIADIQSSRYSASFIKIRFKNSTQYPNARKAFNKVKKTPWDTSVLMITAGVKIAGITTLDKKERFL